MILNLTIIVTPIIIIIIRISLCINCDLIAGFAFDCSAIIAFGDAALGTAMRVDQVVTVYLPFDTPVSTLLKCSCMTIGRYYKVSSINWQLMKKGMHQSHKVV